jgi:hypothetical protein
VRVRGNSGTGIILERHLVLSAIDGLLLLLLLGGVVLRLTNVGLTAADTERKG